MLVVVVIYLIGLYAFSIGFFPIKSSVGGMATAKEDFPADGPRIEGLGIPPAFDRLVFIVVDALRSDFVYDAASKFTYTKRHVVACMRSYMRRLLEQGKGYAFVASATAPTVTLPRVKALLTGMVPNFLDAVTNLAESDQSSTLLATDNWLLQLKHHRNKRVRFYGDDTWLRLFPNVFEKYEGTTSFFVSDTVQVDLNVTRHLDHEIQDAASWDVLVLHYLGLDHIGHLQGPKSMLMPRKQREMDAVVQKMYEHAQDYDSKHGKRTLMVVCGDHGMNAVGNHGGSSELEKHTAMVLLSPSIDATDHSVHAVNQVDIVPTLSLLFGALIPRENVGKVMLNALGHLADEEKLRALQLNAAQMKRVWDAAGGPDKVCGEDASEPVCLYQQAATHHFHYVGGDQSAYSSAQQAYNDFLDAVSSQLTQNAASYRLEYMFGGILLFFVACAWMLLLMWRRAIVWNTAALVALVLYCVSLFASSYVEEEHQYWYFWTNSLWMVWIVTGPLQRDRVVMGVAQMACLRVLRSWNQTGQKWATQVDVKHYLTSSHVWLMWVLFALAALDVLAGIVRTARPWSLRSGAATISSVVGLLCTCLYKVATSTQEATAYATPLAWIVYAATILSLVHARRNTWTILLLFLSKPHNAFLFVVMERQFNLCKQAKLKESPLSNALLICLMYSSFYTFGNSNSIASIDLSNAYNGLQSYNATAVGLLTFLSNWAGPLWWLVAISTLPMPKTAFIWTWMAFHMVSTLVLAISVTILRHHLFIWSVFSPRFLYQLAWAMYLLLGVAFLNQ